MKTNWLQWILGYWLVSQYYNIKKVSGEWRVVK